MKKSKMFWGVLFIALAVLLIVTQLGLVNIHMSIWTLLLTVFFGVSALSSLLHKRATGFLFSIAFLIIIYDEPLGLEAITPWTVLIAALLASIGCHILFPASKKHTHYAQDIQDKKTVKDGHVDIKESFGSCIRYIDSQNMEDITITNRAGMMKIYFDQADIKGQDINCYLYMSCAMLELYIPKTWKVKNCTDSVLSYIDMEMFDHNIVEHTMILKGKINLSEVKIIYV